MKTPRRWAGVGLGAALVVTGLSPLAAAPAFSADATPEGITLRTGALEVHASGTFPQVVQYTARASGAVMHGNNAALAELEINGAAQPVEVRSKKIDGSTAEYTLTPTALDGVEFTARLSVKKNVVTLAFTEIIDPDKKVATLRIPGHDLVTVSSAQPGAHIATADLSVDRAVSGDKFLPITADTALDAKPVSTNTVIANTSELAAAFTTNAMYDDSSGPAHKDSGNFWRQIVKDGDDVGVGVSSGQWLYRAKGAPDTEELPWVKVAITPDANGDGTVDWQDGAIALRDLRVAPFKGDQTPNNVITHIPFNFASQATHPFLRTLDDVKRIAQNTDGLGQVALLKGYTSEGHDSANTDYGDNFNERAGGLDDLNKALKAGEKWNASFGVHINATEIYPEANSFSDEIMDPRAPGWNWLDQSYYIDQRYDTNEGLLDQRISELADATHDNLDMVYVDVYYKYGWLAKKIQESLIDNDFRVASEWADKLAANNTWSHWATDEKYGGSTNKGVNSQILRFVNNTQSDTWNPDPRLGTAHIIEFEGWTGQNDFNAFLENVWTANVPAKFVQHHEIMRWTDDAIDLAGDVRITGTTASDRSITVDGDEVLRGDTYLLPWSSKPGQKVDKMYHYNPAGGETTWTLTDTFAKNRSLQLFALGDGGRTKVADVAVVDGAVTIDAEAGQPYVLVGGKKGDSGSALPNKVAFGEGTTITDPGFNLTDLDAWNPRGTVSIDRDAKGRRAALFGEGASSISQRLDKLPAGEYTASAWVGIDKDKTREVTLGIDVPKGSDATVTIDSSKAVNYLASDEWHGTTLQRLKVHFTVPAQGNGKTTLTIAAGDGDAPVRVDDVRIIEAKAPTLGDDVIAREDFEDTDAGWGPFFKGSAGGTNDPRTHIAKRNDYTQKGWNGRKIDNILNGEYSLMAHQENRGLVYRTSDYSVPFEPGQRYRVSFDYQSTDAGQYAWVTGYDSSTGPRITASTEFGAVHETTRFEQIVDASACGDTFVGLNRIGGGAADLIVDDFTVEHLGASEAVPACAQLSGALGADVIQQGTSTEFTTTFTSDEGSAIENVEVALTLPEGWTAEAVTSATAGSIDPKGTLVTRWSITAPADVDGSYDIGATATYATTVDPVGEREVISVTKVKTLPKAPTTTVFASDHDWVTASNGWGPVERDMSNGPQGAGDGTPLTLNGVVYEKGLGAHAPSTIKYFLGGQCSTFTADVGIDDAQASRGTVIFSVKVDGETVVTSPLQTATSETFALTADVSGGQFVELIADTTPDGNGNDHADWADAKFTCG
ncbi:endo-alpha-N-acetylgalactosaminidase family protein [Microbacterium esteraromaticum]|uniref:endo-alpha-N-acetylgalactosaminidase family protein n=1 Tax=Microbacterium esteraromaticum TaxID=57043 RepID=UPI0019D36F08|nr:endo-alpha-N-acetylgalactosaminidase family protein [Microbacterium esteraromaticum]MBN7794132.1 NPCBM/NEW2 domain-containing protein [Microbacterium esteraromaticum]